MVERFVSLNPISDSRLTALLTPWEYQGGERRCLVFRVIKKY